MNATSPRAKSRDADLEAIRQGQAAAARIRAREQAERAARPPEPDRSTAAERYQRDSQQFDANMRAVAATGLLLASPAAPYLLWQSWAVQSGLVR